MIKREYKILIYGAGVIGSIYAVNFAKAGYNVSMLARSKRLEILKQKGLLYEDKQGYSTANVEIVEILNPYHSLMMLWILFSSLIIAKLIKAIKIIIQMLSKQKPTRTGVTPFLWSRF